LKGLLAFQPSQSSTAAQGPTGGIAWRHTPVSKAAHGADGKTGMKRHWWWVKRETCLTAAA